MRTGLPFQKRKSRENVGLFWKVAGYPGYGEINIVSLTESTVSC